MTVCWQAQLGYYRDSIKTEIGNALEPIKGIGDLQKLVEIHRDRGHTVLQGSPIADIFGQGFQLHARGNEKDSGADF